ncbi:mechanosensitive ion channel family protein [Anaerocolumna sp. MB42-C2]|uniref:mechanosensitive ion channel family protein n=1 Tax=Anaerocolumna sp. MB42-C2 TaxID=3070997 RepID=UPI0027DF24CB|nr:mechanosensitive ion channel domain-containing protein [Anaerocolumna sp. MB42-C2]WMJ85618.1 mechanosensitive ion channel [Anaerocolumna sp. MB42-C2]
MGYFTKIFTGRGINSIYAQYLSFCIMILILTLLCFILNFIIKKVILKLITKLIESNNHRWDNIMLDRQVFKRLSYIVPAIVVYNAAPLFYQYETIIKRFTLTYIFLIAIFVLNSALDSANDIYNLYPISRIRPIKGLIQVVKIAVYIIVGIIIIANLLGQSPIALLSGIGALTAVFSLVFKDSILGFVAGIQLTSNKMLQIGDWIEMDKYGADGEVMEVTLNTVKVQNFDKTIVTIPAYALVSDSFKNWRGMQESGGRRIKRAVYMDTTSICFCTPEMIERFRQIHYLKGYIHKKEEELKKFNMEAGAESDMPVNGRHLTNIEIFRIYILNYIENYPGIRKEMPHIVRQLPPGEFGLPLEIYAFTGYTDWVNYENLQADIFDHILSVAAEFGLRIFQNPTGQDLRIWGKQE